MRVLRFKGTESENKVLKWLKKASSVFFSHPLDIPCIKESGSLVLMKFLPLLLPQFSPMIMSKSKRQLNLYFQISEIYFILLPKTALREVREKVLEILVVAVVADVMILTMTFTSSMVNWK